MLKVLSKLSVVELDLTNDCNHNCIWCINRSFREREPVTMDKEFAFDVIKQLHEFGVKTLIFSGGGEPLLHPQFSKILLYAKSYKFNIGVITNGVRIQENYAMIKDCCDFLIVSIDAGTAETYKKLHKGEKAEFQKVISSCKQLKSEGFPMILFSFLVHPDNYYEVPRLLEFIEIHKINGLLVRPIYLKKMTYNQRFLTEAKRVHTNVSNTEMSPYINWNMNYFQDLGEMTGEYQHCFFQSGRSVICANGKMYLCSQVRGVKKFEIGDFNTESLVNIWAGERRELVLSRLDISRCPACRYKEYNRVMQDITCNTGRDFLW
uniref:Putative radical SAM superfamily protein n=1 Tax=viral metagenome TaxID=1070528 RepID=A0A6M3IG91_9ZZZZ